MGLEVGRPVGDHGVTDAVRLIEGVARERLDQIEDIRSQLFLEPFGRGPGHETVPLLGHQRRNLFPHGFAHDVGFTQGVTGKLLQDQQNLVLVDDDPVGLVQKVFQAGVGVGYRYSPVFCIDEGVDIFHGSGPVKRDHGGDVTETGGLQLPDVPLHSGALELEQVCGVSRRKQLECSRVVKGELVQIHLYALALLHQLDGPVQY